MIKVAVITLVIIGVAPQAVLGTTYRVDVAGGGDYLTIQEGLDAASEGDTVLVARGTYSGPGNRNLGFGGTNIVLLSEVGLDATTIDCEGVDRAFSFDNTGEDTTSIIRGFEIVNGHTEAYHGGGIIVRGAGVVIEDCLIRDCTASHNGGGLYSGYSQQGARIRNCIFQDNFAPFRGGGASVDHGAAEFRRCLFVGNSTTDNSEQFYGGGALHCNWCEWGEGNICEVWRCTFVANSSGGSGSGVYAWNSVMGLLISRSIVAFNTGPGIGFDSEPSVENFTFSLVYGNESGNASEGYSTLIRGEPLFCGLAVRDFTHCANSPCLPTNNIYNALIGFADEGCGDCYSSPTEQKSLGGVKALYK